MRFYADVRIEWGVDMDANSEEEFVSLLKASYKDEYNIDLQDDEVITIIKEDI